MSEDLKEFLTNVPAHAHLIKWPIDKYGTTSELKKVGLAAAGKIAGNEEKQKQVLVVLAMLTKHIQARMAADKAFVESQRKFRSDAEAKRVPGREMFFGGVATKDSAAVA